MIDNQVVKTKPFSKTIRNYCPYCQQRYSMKIELDLKARGLTNTLIKPHEDCKQFLIFIDPNGSVRGTQCIDTEFTGSGKPKTEDEIEMNLYVKLFEDQENISEFYHILELEGENL